MAGPMARDTLIAMLFNATADDNSSGRTRSGTMADQAGIIMALPTPSAKTKPNSTQAVVMPASVRMPSIPATTIK